MIELGELERHHQDFDKRKVQVVVISNDDRDVAGATQTDFPHLVVVSDGEQEMARAMQVLHPGKGPNHQDTNMPTTFLVDGTGTVRWVFRPTGFVERLPPDQLLAAIDENLPRP